MDVYESIMRGLTEAVAYEKGKDTALSESVTITSEEKPENCFAFGKAGTGKGSMVTEAIEALKKENTDKK